MKYQGVRYRCQVIELIDKEIAESIVNNLEKRYYSDGEIQNMILQKLLEKQNFESFEDTLKYMASLQKHEMFNRFLKHILDKYDFSSIYKKINSSEFKILSGYFYDEIGICPSCGKTFLKTKSSIVYCSSKCSNSADDVKKKKEETCLKHYGTKNHTQSEIYKADLIKRNQEKYGVDYYTETQEFKDKNIQTRIKKYGDPNYRNIEKAKKTRAEKAKNDPNYVKNTIKKRKKSCLEKYGVESASKLDDVKNKVKQSKFEKYGDANFSNREKSRKTCLKKYGVENVSQLEENKIKTKQTLLKKFGNDVFTRTEYYKEKARKRFIDRMTLHGKFKIENLREYLLSYIDDDGIFNMKQMMKDFGLSFSKCCLIKKQNQIYNPNVKNGVSKTQLEIFNFIQSENKILNHRGLIYPYEVDIYLPNDKLAIEYDGLYWHSALFKDKNYHIDKTLKCKKKGVQLLHIFEFEDIEIWKSIINNKLGLNQKIYARKCSLQEIDHNTAKVFCEQNHLQGYVNSSIRLGLYFEDKLVQVMTFGKPRFNKDYDYELLRLCSLKGFNVVGGASKLFKYFRQRNIGSVISYANIRYSNGLVYEKLGFEKIGISEPNYVYFNNFNVMTRYQCQKHKLKKLFENYSDDKTEEQIMNENGYRKTFDCGNLIYVMKG